MRLTIKLAVVAAVVGLLATGFLPPLFARGQLDGYARDAAQKSSTILMSEGAAAAEEMAGSAVATHKGVHLVQVRIEGDTVFVTVSEDVRTYAHRFHLTSTEGSALGQ